MLLLFAAAPSPPWNSLLNWTFEWKREQGRHRHRVAQRYHKIKGGGNFDSQEWHEQCVLQEEEQEGA